MKTNCFSACFTEAKGEGFFDLGKKCALEGINVTKNILMMVIKYQI